MVIVINYLTTIVENYWCLFVNTQYNENNKILERLARLIPWKKLNKSTYLTIVSTDFDFINLPLYQSHRPSFGHGKLIAIIDKAKRIYERRLFHLVTLT